MRYARRRCRERRHRPTARCATGTYARRSLRVAHTAPRKQSRNEGYVRIETFAGDPPLIERIKETIDRGFRPKEIVVLVRGRNDGARVAEQLLDFKRRNDDPRYRFDIMTQEALVIAVLP